jgi:hypothetical protein
MSQSRSNQEAQFTISEKVKITTKLICINITKIELLTQILTKKAIFVVVCCILLFFLKNKMNNKIYISENIDQYLHFSEKLRNFR